MILVLIIGAGLAGLSVALLLRAFVLPRARTVQTIAQIGAYGFNSASAAPEMGSVRASFDSLAGAVGSLVSARFGPDHEADLRNELMAAGLYNMPPRRFIGYRILCAVCAPIAWLWVGSSAHVSPLLVVAGTVFGLLAGWAGPMSVVRNRSRRRLEQIDYDLPELIDLLVVTVEAGLGFNGSLQVAAGRMEGPLGDELRLTLQEQSFGLSSEESLKNMLARCDTGAVRSFVRSVLQGEALGVSIGQILRNLSTEMRVRRRQAAEEKAQKAPVKILFPLIFFIFPAMFVILLAPAMITFMQALGGGG